MPARGRGCVTELTELEGQGYPSKPLEPKCCMPWPFPCLGLIYSKPGFPPFWNGSVFSVPLYIVSIDLILQGLCLSFCCKHPFQNNLREGSLWLTLHHSEEDMTTRVSGHLSTLATDLVAEGAGCGTRLPDLSRASSHHVPPQPSQTAPPSGTHVPMGDFSHSNHSRLTVRDPLQAHRDCLQA